MFKEFKEFAMRGNMLDLAVGIIIGAAFNTVIKSMVDNIIMPPIGVLVGRVNFSNLLITLPGGGQVKYGLFINDIVNFLIIAFSVFLIVRWANRLESHFQAPTGAPTTRECPYCISTIPIKATRCPECTSELPPVPVVNPGTPAKAAKS